VSRRRAGSLFADIMAQQAGDREQERPITRWPPDWSSRDRLAEAARAVSRR